VVLCASLGCAWLPTSEPRGLEPEPELPISFAAPEMVTVRPGDTLGEIAKRHAVSVEDLRSWNGLADDTIEVDQVLLVWTAPPEPPKRPKEQPSRLASALESVLAPAPAAPPPTAVAMADPPAADPGTAADVDPAAPPAPRISIERPAILGMLGVSTESDVDLADVASGMEHHDSTDLGSTGLSGRTMTSGQTADKLVLAQRPQANGGVQIPNTPVAAPHLTKPIPKQCLKGPSATVSESGSVTSGGLSVGQINAAMAQIGRYTVKCFPSGTRGTYSVQVEITAGCNGQVSNVFLVDAGVVPSNVTSCLEKTLGYASFPAHSIPGGVTFKYPMKFSF
jgi:hypothetical protein